MKITAFQFKVIGEIILLIPVGLLVTLGVGEMLSGDNSGIQHFVELVPFIILAIACWYFPKIGGLILTTLAAILAVLYFIYVNPSNVFARILNDIILFLPPIIAGIFFATANLEEHTE